MRVGFGVFTGDAGTDLDTPAGLETPPWPAFTGLFADDPDDNTTVGFTPTLL